MLKNISIAKKLPVLFAAMTTISVASVGVMSYVQMSNTIESDAIAKVVAVEESMGQALDKQFELIDADLRVLGNYNLTRDALVRLNVGFENLRKEGENPARYLQDAYLTNSQYPVGQRHLADKADDKSYYTKFHAKYHDVFRRFMLEYNYYDVFLMNMEGDVVYSVYKENDFAMNVSGPALNGSGLHNAFDAALENGISFTDFQPYAPSAGDLAAFGGIAIKDKFGEDVGVLAVQLKPETFTDILSDDAGFSFDTKTFILGPDYRIRFSQGVKPDDLESNPEFFVRTSEIVSDGKEKITRMVDSMDRIKQSSADIAKIIKVIDEIAFQTNLLALNAAVEAVRAGQHGRGFAVVAAEVRNLAGRSAKAAQETSELIVGSSKRVEAGVEVSNQAREAFDKIADDIAQVTDLVGKITLASDEQARGVTYINRAIQEISDAAMTNAVRAEELTVVANELSTSTDGVSHQIARFNLGNPGSSRRATASAAAPEMHAPVSNGAMMNGNASSGLDVDERGFGRY